MPLHSTNSPVAPKAPLVRTDGRPIKVVYLDQNKWIDLARAVVSPEAHPALRQVLEHVSAKAEAGEAMFPLTWSNLLETQKVNRLERRFHLTRTQVALSDARVFHAQRRLLDAEFEWVLRKQFNLDPQPVEPGWYLSDRFFEAGAPIAALSEFLDRHPRALIWISENRKDALAHYLMETPEAARKEALRHFTEGCEALRIRIEERRTLHRGEKISMRRRLYSAITALEQQEHIISVTDRLGIEWTRLGENNGAGLKAAVRSSPSLHVEREIALRLEAQDRPIELNDMRDMRSFCSVVPYADIVVAERQFTNLARQAGLHEHYGVQLETDIRALLHLL